MQKSLNNPITLKVQEPKPEYLGFQTIVNQIVWPIAVIKFNGTDAYCWDWMRGGHLLLYVDFGSGNVGNFGKYEESHTSYHKSGRHQSRVTGKAKMLYLSPTQGTPVAQIRQWINFASVPAPLTSPLTHKPKIPVWDRAIKKITLKSENFAGRQDIYLRACLCRKESVHVLVKRFYLGTWVLGSGSTRLVVAADPQM
jgi:hypothetical protein